jgi:hypothetical protein
MGQYGWNDVPDSITLQRQVIGGEASWLPNGNRIITREECTTVEINGTPARAISGNITSEFKDWIQHTVLTMTLPPDSAVPVIGDTINVNTTVTTDAGTITTVSGPYRISGVSNGCDAVTGDMTIQIQAEDFLDAQLDQSLPFAYLTPIRQLVEVQRSMGVSGNSYANLIQGVLAWAAGGSGNVNIDLWPSASYPSDEDLLLISDGPLNGSGTVLTARQALQWLYEISPFRAFLSTNGTTSVSIAGPGQINPQTGVVDCEDGGTIQAPTRRISRSIRQADFTAVSWYFVWHTPTGPLGSGQWVTNMEFWAYVQSTNPRVPHLGALGKTKVIVDRANASVIGGRLGANRAAQAMLANVLRDADTVTMQVDAGYPTPPLGSVIGINDCGITGNYSILKTSRPLDSIYQEWLLGWESG